MQRPQIDFVAHITEAWMQKGFPEGRIADNPERMETILFNILSKDYQTLVVNPLRRNPSRLTIRLRWRPSPVRSGTIRMALSSGTREARHGAGED